MLEDNGIVEHLDELNRLTDEAYAEESEGELYYFMVLLGTIILTILSPFLFVTVGVFFWKIILSALFSLA